MSKRKKVKKMRQKGFNPAKFQSMFMDKLKEEMVKRGMCSGDEFDKALGESEVLKNGNEVSSNSDWVEDVHKQG